MNRPTQDTPLADLIAHILSTHHQRLRDELPGLRKGLAGALPELRRAFGELSNFLEGHLMKEENILFPTIVALEAGRDGPSCGLEGPIRQMNHEHTEVEAYLDRIRGLLTAETAAERQLAALLDDLEEHAELEENELFPLALRLAHQHVPDELLDESEGPAPEAPPPTSVHPAAALCRRAESQHTRMLDTIDSLDASFEGGHHSLRLMAPWRHFRVGIRTHFSEEEAQVFPAIRDLAEGREPQGDDWSSPLHDLQFELDEIRTIADALRNAAPDAGEREGELLDLLDLLESHAAVEEEQLFPMALELLESWSTARHTHLSQLGALESAREPVRVLRSTQGNCNTCLAPVPAKVVRYEDVVQLEKDCPEHGITTQILSRSPAYWEDVDSFFFKVNSENYPQRDYIVRMTERCNLDCPICLAKANTEETPDLDLSGLEQLLSERRGIKVDLMAAEPTLREDLEDWIRKVKATGNIAALHTNGLKLGKLEYAQRLKDAGVDEVFLQFDGFDDDANEVLRGARLLKARIKALANLRKVGISTSLIVVIARGLNEDQVAKTFRFALQPENDHIKEVFFLGLRMLGSARDALVKAGKLRSVDEEGGADVSEMAMMPDELIDLLCRDEPHISRDDIRRFNKLYFAMLSAFKVKKCLYVQHYLVSRDGLGDMQPISEILDLPGLEQAAVRYGDTFGKHPTLARARFLGDLARFGVTRDSARMLADLVRLQMLFRTGMNLKDVPRRFLLLGFITACDPHNFDADVAINCGKGELSVDGGFIESGAVANVRREARFADTDRAPSQLKADKRERRLQDS